MRHYILTKYQGPSTQSRVFMASGGEWTTDIYKAKMFSTADSADSARKGESNIHVMDVTYMIEGV